MAMTSYNAENPFISLSDKYPSGFDVCGVTPMHTTKTPKPNSKTKVLNNSQHLY